MSETRARRRIRLAVESRGRELTTLEFEPIHNGSEMCGDAGGWYGTLKVEGSHPLSGNHDIWGYNVEEAVAWVDHFLDPPEPCDCDTSDKAICNPSRTDKMAPLHEPSCRWYLRYELPWWTWKREPGRNGHDDQGGRR